MTIRTVLGAPHTKAAPPYATFPGEARVPVETEPQHATREAPEAEEAEEFDPGEHTVDEVKDYVTEHPDEVDDVHAAEDEGKARVTLLTWLEEFEPPEGDA